MNRLLALMFALVSVSSVAAVKLPALFTDNMVLQRETNAAVWGWAQPRAGITVTGSWGAGAKATANADGKWLTHIKTPKAGGPYQLIIVTPEGTIILKNVMIGEVWVCSGQSNMEWPLSATRGGPAEAAAANYPNIRLFTVARRAEGTRQNDSFGWWQPCTPQSVPGFSAVAYYFGRKLYQSLKMPIGLIHTSWGGTEVELWTSDAALRRVPELGATLAKNDQAEKDFKATYAAYTKSVLALDPGWPAWTVATMNDSEWKTTDAPKVWSGSELSAVDGAVYYRADFMAPESWAGKAAVLELGQIDDEDVTFVNGRQVGANTNYAADRKYTVPAGVIHSGKNTITVRVLDTGGEGGMSAASTSMLVRAGAETAPLVNWRYKLAFELKSLPAPPQPNFRPHSTLYNGMIYPLLPFSIRGAIWYQGESNVGRAYQYRTSFPNMIKNWREDWGLGDFPFYYVQIAPFSGYQGAMSAELREAQTMTLATRNTGMAVVTDLVDNLGDIHPVLKEQVGERLALWALAKDYGQRNQVFSGPLYDGVNFAGSKVSLRFKYVANGLVARGGDLAGFTIAGVDKKFYPAEAKIVGNEIVVSSPSVPLPMAVRYGWSDAPVLNLFNTAGLPATPFRTDTWPGVTDGVKW